MENTANIFTAEIAVLRDQANIEDIFVILHFDGPPAHFACLHVKKKKKKKKTIKKKKKKKKKEIYIFINIYTYLKIIICCFEIVVGLL